MSPSIFSATASLILIEVCYPQFTDRAEYWSPHTLQYRFIAEARRLWELEADEPRITTIQTGILFNTFYCVCGLDVIGQAYSAESIKLAQRMRLFDRTVGGESKRSDVGRAFTAWGLFNWES